MRTSNNNDPLPVDSHTNPLVAQGEEAAEHTEAIIVSAAPVRRAIVPRSLHRTGPKRSAAQRLNLKRAYQAFVKALPAAGSSARSSNGYVASTPTLSDSWPLRPYAASI